MSMAGKGLGMIHTVNALMTPDRQDQIWTVDLSTKLSRQLQYQVRQGNYFKIVGIDMSLQGLADDGTTTGGGQVSGTIRYWAPTRGRCAAYRGAFNSTMSAMKQQGLSIKGNPLYDFKVAFRDPADSDLINPNESTNLATLDGATPLCLTDSANAWTDVFKVHNSNVLARTTDATALTNRQGFALYGNNTDFVLNEALDGFFGNSELANEQFEEIPFQLLFEEQDQDPTQESESGTLSFQWRPDPALYVAAMAGLIEIQFDALSLDGEAESLDVQLAIHVAGWKSIMGDPDKKNRSSMKKRSSRGKGSRRKSKK